MVLLELERRYTVRSRTSGLATTTAAPLSLARPEYALAQQRGQVKFSKWTAVEPAVASAIRPEGWSGGEGGRIPEKGHSL